MFWHDNFAATTHILRPLRLCLPTCKTIQAEHGGEPHRSRPWTSLGTVSPWSPLPFRLPRCTRAQRPRASAQASHVSRSAPASRWWRSSARPPWAFTSSAIMRGVAGFFAWLSSFKVVLLAVSRGPLEPSLPNLPFHFMAALPVKQPIPWLDACHRTSPGSITFQRAHKQAQKENAVQAHQRESVRPRLGL